MLPRHVMSGGAGRSSSAGGIEAPPTRGRYPSAFSTSATICAGGVVWLALR
jgi:hypothetical protein